MDFHQPGLVRVDSKPPPPALAAYSSTQIKSRPSLSSKPPISTKKSFSNTHDLRDSSFNSQKSRQSFLEDNQEPCVLLKGIFTIDGKSSDVDLYENRITWRHITANSDETRRSSSARRESLANENRSNELYEIPFERIFCVEPKCYQRVVNTKSEILNENFIRNEENTFEGFLIHVFDRLKPNYYEPRSLKFNHPHNKTCRKWLLHLYKHVKSLQIERRVLVCVNPFAGEKRTRSILNFIVNPLLELANITLDTLEFHNDKPLRDQLFKNNINIVNYYGIILVCGDGSVSRVLRDLLEKQVNDDSHTRKIDCKKHALKTPVCIMPGGTTNLIATSIYGSISLYTPLNYLIYGNCINVDISSIYTPDKRLHSFSFGLSCGYGTDVTRYVDKYSKLGLKKIQAALARAAAKKRTLVELEIKYLPAMNYPEYVNQLRCYRGCTVCDAQERVVNGTSRDEVQDFDQVAESLQEIEDNLGESYRRDSSSNNEWRTISGKFMHVELLSNAMLWNMASGGGLSKYGHLADGCMDLILVDKVPRKEFMRFVRRHTNRKNQLDLPFVKNIKIKECKIFIKNTQLLDENVDITSSQLNVTKKLSDGEEERDENVYDFNDDNESMSDFDAYRQHNKTHSISTTSKKGPKMFFISKKDSNESDTLPSPTNITMRKRSSSLQRSGQFILEKSKSIVNFFKTTEGSTDNTSSTRGGKSSRMQRSGSALSSQTLASKKELNYSTKSPYLWNIDWNLVELQNIHVKCERQYLSVFGCGIDLDTEHGNSLNSCFNL